MSSFDPRELSHSALFDLPNSLIISEPGAEGRVMPFLLIDESGRIFGFNGHVDLGTGIRTALGQVVAEELDVAPEQVTMILGHTELTPDQGATIASDTMQKTAIPLRAAAAQARAYLVEQAASLLDVEAAHVGVADGFFSAPNFNRQFSYAELVMGHRVHLSLDRDARTKSPSDYRLVGSSQARVDLPAKAAGDLVFVHDMRVPGMLHGRVVRPPYAGIDVGSFVGTSLIGVDEDSIGHLPGIVAIVVIGDFIGIVAEREHIAVAAMHLLEVEWKPTPTFADLSNLEGAISAQQAYPRKLQDKGDVDAALGHAAVPMSRSYVWPYQMHASIGPSCSLADWRPERLRIWSGTQNPHPLRNDLARLLAMPGEHIEVIRMEASGCYGRNCADDVCADAALLSRAVGRPVRVQLSREQEHVWEPKGTGQIMRVDGGLNAAGDTIAYDYSSRYPSNGAPTLALLLTGVVPPIPEIWEMGDRTSVAPYDYPNMRVTVHDMAPIARASWLRGVSALPNSFAHESWIDEAATMAGVDPVEYRLRYLRDRRGIAVVEATAERAGWTPHTAPRSIVPGGEILRGQGFAYALYVHSKFPGYGAAWAAWVADVTVNIRTGDVAVTKVTVGHDAGLMINPDGVRHQIEGNVVQSTSRALFEQVAFDENGVAAAEWGGYPILTFPDVPEIDVLMLPRPDQPPLGAGESASVPSAAAIANALFDATGIRFREPPFTPEKVRAALAENGLLLAPKPGTEPPQVASKAGWLSRAALALSGVTALGLALKPWNHEIPRSPAPPPGFYSAETLDRGRLVAAAGDCAVCHTAPGGTVNSGGLGLETPFGTVYSTNLTPDAASGIGAWSYAAFERAMRHGVSRDGRFLYPAFPYTSFAKINDTDMEALYAFLMSQTAIRADPPETKLAFPFGFRSGIAVWNALFHDPRAWRDDPSKSSEWNRGGYLVEGLGHCSACHSPRNALGAEARGKRHLTGAEIDGWWAPSLVANSTSPVPWRAGDFYNYLRTGHSQSHGVAAGPMAPVVDELSALPDDDIRAMATYLASLSDRPDDKIDRERSIRQRQARSDTRAIALPSAGARTYEAACAVCHDQAYSVPTFGIRPDLAINGSVHAPIPENLVRVILHGIDSDAARRHGTMPGFGQSMSDASIAGLVRYVRQRFAPDKPGWMNIEEAIVKARRQPTAH